MPYFLMQASLGTTKYCSYFLKSMQCPKPDCMYLHELGDEAASFTKEEMQVMLNILILFKKHTLLNLARLAPKLLVFDFTGRETSGI